MFARTRVTLMADDGEKFFGEGPYRLLKGADETGSLFQAAQLMEMSYSKAIRLLKRAEKAIGSPPLDRVSGGASGGGSRLTPQGRQWMERYEAYRDACAAENHRLFLQFFPEQHTPAEKAGML